MGASRTRRAVDEIDSDEELPSLDELLRKPRTALAPTSANTTSRSPKKSKKNLNSTAKSSQPAVLKNASTKIVSFADDGLSVPPLQPPSYQKSPSKDKVARSPSTNLKGESSPRKKIEGSSGRQRTFKNPAKNHGLLFQPLDAAVRNGRAKPQGRGAMQNKAILKPFNFASDEESDVSQEVDIFKGTGILRKTPRRAAKTENKYPESEINEVEQDGEQQLTEPKDADDECGSTFDGSETDNGNDSTFHSALDGEESDGPLADRLGSLTLKKPSNTHLSPQKSLGGSFPQFGQRKDSGMLSAEAKSQHLRPSLSQESLAGLENDSAAILKSSPPASPSAARLPLRPSTPPTAVSPPASPGKLRSPSKIKSPSKARNAANQTISRPSLDAFWAQDIVNSLDEQRSPAKTLTSPRKKHLLDFFADHGDDEENIHDDSVCSASPNRKAEKHSPQKQADCIARRAERERLKAFNERKEQYAQDFLSQLDSRITNGEISRLTANAGGVQIVWSKKLNSTAGRANWRRERRMPSNPATSSGDRAGEPKAECTFSHVASIELASKVVDNETRLYNVLAHEFCHLTNFMISRELKQPHGSSFQAWARKVTKTFGRTHQVEVTTKHDYAIAYKYVWVCANVDCQTEYKRHSKSIDTQRHTCGNCKGILIQILPRPRGGAQNPAKKDSQRMEVAKSAYSRFVKEQFQAVKEDMPPGSPAKDVMKEVAVRYRATKKQVERVEVVEVADEAAEEGHNRRSLSPARSAVAGDVDGVVRKLDFFTI